MLIRLIWKQVAPVIDLLLIPFVAISACILKVYRRGSPRMPMNTAVLKKIGIFPVRDHYYEPLFNDRHLSRSLREKRNLPGLDFRLEEQRELLGRLVYQQEFDDFCREQSSAGGSHGFSIDNGSFESGDAEFLFNLLRYLKPKRVIEIGCGSSTRIISQALKLNSSKDARQARHTCIEPYEQPWLSELGGIELIRKKVEDCGIRWQAELQDGDLLFIDSSHVIRPQGDVLHEYLEIIPKLSSGVYVHVHDIFTPRDYPDDWLRNKVLFWNEQYLLEATLSNNTSYRIVASLNYLKHEEYEGLRKVCTYLTPQREPGSFYFRIN